MTVRLVFEIEREKYDIPVSIGRLLATGLIAHTFSLIVSMSAL